MLGCGLPRNRRPAHTRTTSAETIHDTRIAVRTHGSLSAGNNAPPARMENDACVAAKFKAIAVRCSDSHHCLWSSRRTQRHTIAPATTRPSTANAPTIAMRAGTPILGTSVSRKSA